ncbi:MAG TPA: thiamine phosphate synthase [Acidobacteriaceae bacterium]|nr:thiamine phosphate synthase [Acidobacteriaceae bacterium]
MQFYAITDRKRSTRPLLTQVKDWSSGGVQFIQLREKDLDRDALGILIQQLMDQVNRRHSKLLINVPDIETADWALAEGADGVHLAGKPVAGAAQRFRRTHERAIISVPCHSFEDIGIAAAERVDLMIFSPVFEKVFGEGIPTQGLEGLRKACAIARGIPVFALGGVTAANAPDCVAAGATGIAAIRLFAGDDWRSLATNMSLKNHI